MSLRAAVALAAVPLLLLTACGDDEPADPPAVVPPSVAPPPASATPAPTGTPAERAAALVATLPEEDLAGQVLMPYAYGSAADKVSDASAAKNRELGDVATPAEMVARYRLGALILVGFSADDPTGTNQPTTNVDNPQQVRALTDGLRAAAARLPAGSAPMLVGTDQEYGVVTRVKTGVTALPSAMAVGAANRPAQTEAAWKAAGEELAAMGVNVDFAPVADVLGPAGSGVIGSRSFGDDPKVVSAQVAAAVRGLAAGGVASTIKHFPGHGHTTADSHTTLPVVSQSRAALDRQDLPPFRAGIGAGAGFVMSGHLDVRAVDSGVAATFSRKVMTDLLRTELKFTGVAVTDAMNMEPAMKWPAGEAAVRALNAGNDLLLMPPDVGAAHAGILDGLRTGALKRERLVEAATRVLTQRFALDRPAPALDTLASAGHQAAARAVATSAVTVLKGRCARLLPAGKVMVTAAGGREQARANLVKALQAAGADVVAAGAAEIRLVGYGDTVTDLSRGAAVTVAMDTPYLLAQSDSPVLVATYSSSPASMAGLADVLTGRAKPTGRSPVPVRGLPRTAC
ncbi:beta-N-acetylhexosaminidase [Spirilliplanes yamanashiensis]|nr:glycoside hydrolase family 3 N-terminal domain-containing protein [Spirilliplanes yamanashiensis]MDP9816625.1 beta-N-acetylhexosaminidase [Spirilliplanes yamanashiensis]